MIPKVIPKVIQKVIPKVIPKEITTGITFGVISLDHLWMTFWHTFGIAYEIVGSGRIARAAKSARVAREARVAHVVRAARVARGDDGIGSVAVGLQAKLSTRSS